MQLEFPPNREIERKPSTLILQEKAINGHNKHSLAQGTMPSLFWNKGAGGLPFGLSKAADCGVWFWHERPQREEQSVIARFQRIPISLKERGNGPALMIADHSIMGLRSRDDKGNGFDYSLDQ